MSLEKENRVHPCTRLFSIKEQLLLLVKSSGVD